MLHLRWNRRPLTTAFLTRHAGHMAQQLSGRRVRRGLLNEALKPGRVGGPATDPRAAGSPRAGTHCALHGTRCCITGAKGTMQAPLREPACARQKGSHSGGGRGREGRDGNVQQLCQVLNLKC